MLFFMNESLQSICQAVHTSTREAVDAAWPAEATADALLDWTAASLNHVGGTVAGFQQISQAKVDCRAGCSFCCWLRIDVRAHEVFLIARHLRQDWPAEALTELMTDLELTRRALTGGHESGRNTAPRPCVLLVDGLCSVYEVRPAACRRYLSGSVEACEAQWKSPDRGEGPVQHPILAEPGRAAATAVHHAMFQNGYDGFSYDLPLALAEAMTDPECEARWLRKEKAFSERAESLTPPGFSQREALERLKTSLRGTVYRVAVNISLWLLLLVAVPWGVQAEEPVPQTDDKGPARGAAALSPITKAGDFVRKMALDGFARTYVVHVPEGLDLTKPVPVVLLLHGAGMNAQMMQHFCGMNAQARKSGFVAVYPNGTGVAQTFLTWNSGGIGPERAKPDDTAFIRAVLDELERQLKVDRRRVYAAGLSNGGMMSYRLGAELSDRIAAVAAVGGTLAIPDPKPGRPVPAMHFHGTLDRIVPFAGPKKRGRTSFQSVAETVDKWRQLNCCPEKPVILEVPDQFDDGTTVRIFRYGPGKAGTEVVQVDVIGGGHTWPGQQPSVSWIGKSTKEISANQMIWDFFQKHPLPSR